MTDVKDSIEARKKFWQGSLGKNQSEPLKYCPEFPVVARRWNDWWNFRGDRPLMVAEVADENKKIRRDKAFDLLALPEEWLAVRRKQVEHTHYFAEALPNLRVDIGPVAIGAFLGAPLHFACAENTSWQDPVIESWENPPALTLSEGNAWLQRVLRLLKVVAEDAAGEYVVCLPDLSGAIDVLMVLRGQEKLCIDLYEHGEAVLSAASHLVDVWEAVFSRMYDIVLDAGAGVTQWVTCWADSPFTVPTCDFNALIGPKDFGRFCLPSLSDQAQRAGLCVFHLDGRGPARHAEALAKDPHITAVQYTPGAATPSALEMLPMLHMLQQHEVPLFIESPAGEFKQLARELDPSGTAIRVSGLQSPEQAEDLIEWRDKTF